jgi:hypothetical protein
MKTDEDGHNNIQLGLTVIIIQYFLFTFPVKFPDTLDKRNFPLLWST